MPENENPRFEKGDIALYIAPLTAICYGLSFIQRVGEYNFYGIPTEFIELDLNSITVNILSVFPILIFTVLFYHRTFFKIRRPEDNDSSTASGESMKKRALIFIILSIFVIYFSFKLIGYIMLAFIIFVVLTAFGILFGLALYKKRRYLYSLFIGLVLSGAMSYAMGFVGSALELTHTIVKDKNKNYLLLEKYKDKFLLAPIDLKKKEFSKNITFRDISDNNVIFTKGMSMLKPEN
jgi:hypothetical protein